MKIILIGMMYNLAITARPAAVTQLLGGIAHKNPPLPSPSAYPRLQPIGALFDDQLYNGPTPLQAVQQPFPKADEVPGNNGVTSEPFAQREEAAQRDLGEPMPSNIVIGQSGVTINFNNKIINSNFSKSFLTFNMPGIF